MNNFLKKFFKQILAGWFILSLFISYSTMVALAGSPFMGDVSTSLLSNAGLSTTIGAGGEKAAITGKIGEVIETILEFIGILILLIIIYGGFLWLTAGGNEEQVTKARKWIINAFLGALVVGIAYALTAFILSLTQ